MYACAPCLPQDISAQPSHEAAPPVAFLSFSDHYHQWAASHTVSFLAKVQGTPSIHLSVCQGGVERPILPFWLACPNIFQSFLCTSHPSEPSRLYTFWLSVPGARHQFRGPWDIWSRSNQRACSPCTQVRVHGLMIEKSTMGTSVLDVSSREGRWDVWTGIFAWNLKSNKLLMTEILSMLHVIFVMLVCCSAMGPDHDVGLVIVFVHWGPNWR